MDIWIAPDLENIEKANQALVAFGSPYLLNPNNRKEILQLGVAPDRIDILRHVSGVRFEKAWKTRIKGRYGKAETNWIDLDSLIRIKNRIDHPRHKEDVRVLRDVKKRISRSSKKTGQKN
jgi:hypothetical protein